MSDIENYKPEIGTECEVLNTKLSSAEYEKCMPLYVGQYAIVYTSTSCNERTGQLDNCTFRPISTKADVERERLLKIIDECIESGISITAKEIQRDGFTIPKKVKRSDIYRAIGSTEVHMSISSNKILSYAICDLLGDLVEQD